MTNSPPLPDFDLDCRGQQCPGPVLALARAVAELDDGVFLRVFADDPAFPQDVRAWSRTANAELVGFSEREDCYEAMIRIGAPCSSIVRICTGEVCVRSSISRPSASRSGK